MKTISENILAVLDSCEVDGLSVRLVCGQLDRKTYIQVIDVLEAIGGKWNRKAKAHIFESDPAERLQECMLTGEYSNKKQDFGFFETPAAVALRVHELADIRDGHRILEPSAGKGALINDLPKHTYDIQAVEIQDEHATHLNTLGYAVLCCDFLTIVPRGVLYDRILMNPPFAVPGNPQADIDHIRHAWEFLKPGGRLVSIMSAGVLFRTNKKTIEFRDWVDCNAGIITKNPEGSFQSSGTKVNTVIVVVNKRGEAA